VNSIRKKTIVDGVLNVVYPVEKNFSEKNIKSVNIEDSSASATLP
jgi:hypothetical protein